jgi:hypothetical protein
LLARRIAAVGHEVDRPLRSRPIRPDEATGRAYADLYQRYLTKSALCT